MTPEQEIAFNRLFEMSNDLENVDFQEIKDLISKSIRQVPVATAILHKGFSIDRVRMNEGWKHWTNEKDVSYIKDEKVINERMTNYGRANRPHQVMFYGTIESTEIPQERVTAFFETCGSIEDLESVNEKGELFTVSRWRILEDILIAEIVFDDKAIINNPDIKRAFDFHMQKIIHHPLRELGLKQIQFFSKEFAKIVKKNQDWDYKISVAYTDLILNDYKLEKNGKIIEGIAFPSVKSNYKGQNVVLHPTVVDKKLKLESASTYVHHKRKKKSFINNHMYANDLGENNESFCWLHHLPKDVVPLDQIIKYHLR